MGKRGEYAVLPSGKSKRGRKPKLTPEFQKKILQLIYDGMNDKDCATLAGIDDGTFYNWLAKGDKQVAGIYHDFREAVLKTRAMARHEDVAVIRNAARSGDWRAAKLRLAFRPTEGYIEHTRAEISGPEGGPVSVAVTISETEAIEALVGELAKLNERARTAKAEK